MTRKIENASSSSTVISLFGFTTRLHPKTLQSQTSFKIPRPATLIIGPERMIDKDQFHLVTHILARRRRTWTCSTEFAPAATFARVFATEDVPPTKPT